MLVVAPDERAPRVLDPKLLPANAIAFLALCAMVGALGWATRGRRISIGWAIAGMGIGLLPAAVLAILFVFRIPT